MRSLQTTAYLSSPLAVYDNYSPSLDALLEWLWLDERGLATPHPSPDNLIEADLPLVSHPVYGWCVSSPHYISEKEQTTRYRKRWDYQDKHLDWGKKRAKFATDNGNSRNYDLPLYLRNVPRIDWFCVGELEEIERLLGLCTGLGKKHSQGYGQVSRWEVAPVEEDWHLWQGDRLMRPVPWNWAMAEYGTDRLKNVSLMNWGYKPPARLKCNQALCVMPKENVVSANLIPR